MPAVPYSQPVPFEPVDNATMTALVHLLQSTQFGQADQLPVVVEEAGRTIGVDLTIYLVGYDQRQLIPVPRPGRPAPAPLNVEGTMAGRSFQLVEPVVVRGDQPHLWVPLLDGTERLGVLRATLLEGVEHAEPGLQERLRWLATLIGHLVTVLGQHGDALDAVRRQHPRNIAAEMIWNLLPPLTFASDRFVAAGLVEPSYEVGGDAFDYAVTGDIAHLAIFDATGHSLAAGTATAVALAAYRNARRNGAGLYQTVRHVDQAVHEQFGGERYVTAVLAELELTTGQLRYVGAGHPHPLVLRKGRVVKSLSEGRRPLLGLDRVELTVAQERLEPGDWVVMFTDGITEARDQQGELFGQQRLYDFLQREGFNRQPPPESLRRLIKAVLEHQQGVLQDDATVLIAGWRTGAHGDLQWGAQ